MVDTPMRIDFQYSGGYGGLFAKRPLAVSVSVDDLGEDERRELLSLVASSGLLETELAQPQASPGLQRDVFTYSLSIYEGGKAKSFTFDDSTAPASVHPLLAFLRKLAITRHKSVP